MGAQEGGACMGRQRVGRGGRRREGEGEQVEEVVAVVGLIMDGD